MGVFVFPLPFSGTISTACAFSLSKQYPSLEDKSSRATPNGHPERVSVSVPQKIAVRQ